MNYTKYEKKLVRMDILKNLEYHGKEMKSNNSQQTNHQKSMSDKKKVFLSSESHDSNVDFGVMDKTADNYNPQNLNFFKTVYSFYR